MMKNTLKVSILFAVGLVCLSTMATPAAASGPTLIGSWEAVRLNGNPGALATFNDDGGWTATGPRADASTGHGAWTKTGPRTFTAVIVIFVFDEDGDHVQTARSTQMIEMAQDGQSYSAVTEAEITLPDGTFVETVAGAYTADRITVEGF